MSDTAPTTPTFSGFDLLAEVGTTPYGKIFQAQQRNPPRLVRLLILEPSVTASEDYVTQFVLRAKTAAGIKHGALPEVYDAAMGDGLYYLSSEWIEGQSVADWMAGAGAMPEPTALQIALGCADALKAAWDQAQLPHGSVSLANIVIQADGALRLMDFALAKKGAANRLADVRALGGALYQMLTGVPLPADVATGLSGLKRAQPQMPDRISRVLGRMLAADPTQAYPGYDQLRDDLAALAEGKEPPHTPPPLTLSIGTPKPESAAGRVASVARPSGPKVVVPPRAATPAPAPSGPRVRAKAEEEAPKSNLKLWARPVIAAVAVGVVWFLVPSGEESQPPPPPPARKAARAKAEPRAEAPALPSWMAGQPAATPTNAAPVPSTVPVPAPAPAVPAPTVAVPTPSVAPAPAPAASAPAPAPTVAAAAPAAPAAATPTPAPATPPAPAPATASAPVAPAPPAPTPAPATTTAPVPAAAPTPAAPAAATPAPPKPLPGPTPEMLAAMEANKPLIPDAAAPPPPAKTNAPAPFVSPFLKVKFPMLPRPPAIYATDARVKSAVEAGRKAAKAAGIEKLRTIYKSHVELLADGQIQTCSVFDDKEELRDFQAMPGYVEKGALVCPGGVRMVWCSPFYGDLWIRFVGWIERYNPKHYSGLVVAWHEHPQGDWTHIAGIFSNEARIAERVSSKWVTLASQKWEPKVGEKYTVLISHQGKFITYAIIGGPILTATVTSEASGMLCFGTSGDYYHWGGAESRFDHIEITGTASEEWLQLRQK
ncbi:MAG: hypothetical protein FJ388_01350 [Verrucomicrobia bacterium]|nr:hypothetical protein [Verrucomicrobiota bacterium]